MVLDDHQYIAQLEKAKQRLDSSLENVLGLYLKQMADHFHKLPRQERLDYVQRVEAVAMQLSVNSKKYKPFDGKQARMIRQIQGLSLADLANKLGAKNVQSARVRISRLENNVSAIQYPIQGVVSDYLKWLEENGYKPGTLSNLEKTYERLQSTMRPIELEALRRMRKTK
ncbi:MAG: hypothetical protein V1837_03775 [Candidatus Woesearchaeota archaeon]